MKRRTIIILSIMIMTTTLMMSSCGEEPENELVDKWECIAIEQFSTNPQGGKLKQDVFSEADDSSTMTIKNGGDITIRIKSNYHNETIKGKWTYVDEEGNNPYLNVTYDDGKTIIVQEDQYENCYIEFQEDDMFSYVYTFWRKK